MNYKSQLKGWAIDRAIEVAKINKDAVTFESLTELASKMSEYAYVPREDLESTAKDLFDLVRTAPAFESSVDALIGTLEHIKSDRQAAGLEKVEEETKQ